MNYVKIFSRGLPYADAAAINWQIRRQELIFVLDINDNISLPQAQRINRLIDDLSKRINTLSKAIFILKKYQKIQQAKSDEDYIMLECPKVECRHSLDAVGIGVRAMGYEHGKHNCKKCDSTLMPKEDIDMYLSLLDLGVNFG